MLIHYGVFENVICYIPGGSQKSPEFSVLEKTHVVA